MLEYLLRVLQHWFLHPDVFDFIGCVLDFISTFSETPVENNVSNKYTVTEVVLFFKASAAAHLKGLSCPHDQGQRLYGFLHFSTLKDMCIRILHRYDKARQREGMAVNG